MIDKKVSIVSLSSRVPTVMALALVVVGAGCPPGDEDPTETTGGSTASSTAASDSDDPTAGPTSTAMTDETSIDSTGATTSAAFCGDGAIDDGEDCDGSELNSLDCSALNLGDGQLMCTEQCLFDYSGCAACGDGEVQSPEVCDGANLDGETCVTQGFDEGALACGNDCQFDTAACIVCGDDSREGAEVCDGVDLAGATCLSQGFTAGALACAADCSGYDTSACTICGDGVLEPGEACDTSEFRGETCVSQGFDGGELSCDDHCNIQTEECCSIPTPDIADVGPDEFGYVMIHSTNANNLCAHQFIDLSADPEATQYLVGVEGGCVEAPAAELLEPFNLYGTEYTQLHINSCAFLATEFGTLNDYGNTCPIPWVQLDPGARLWAWKRTLRLYGAVHYRRFDNCPRPSDLLGESACEVFHWESLARVGFDESWDVNIILYPETGQIVYVYDDVAPPANFTTIGILNEDQDDALGVCDETVEFSVGGSTCFYHPTLSCG